MSSRWVGRVSLVLGLQFIIMILSSPIKATNRPNTSEEELLNHSEAEEALEWSEVSLMVAAGISLVFVLAALYLIRLHKQQWNKMQQMDVEMEQDIHKLIGKLAEVPNIQKTTAVLVDEQQIKKQAATSGGNNFRCIYLDQLLGTCNGSVDSVEIRSAVLFSFQGNQQGGR